MLIHHVVKWKIVNVKQYDHNVLLDTFCDIHVCLFPQTA